MDSFVNFMKKIWVFLDGYKRDIANFYWIVYTMVIPIWFANGVVPYPYDRILQTVGVILTAIGLGHQAFKASKAKKLEMEKASNETSK